MNVLNKVVELEQDADKFGFRWGNTTQIIEQIKSECSEISEHLDNDQGLCDQEALQEEIGDLLHAAFSLCVYCKFSPEDTMKKTLAKFERRMQAVKKVAADDGLMNVDGLSFDELMVFWDKAKAKVG
ncbi:MAG: MazG nucleotide pyrophosphohydrolase domain-containing protein [Legionellaceae bacterium]|nr:MazG nucleotide pyrophosphohydrolase domain-containing protein [Legionellaceae bacterium]